MQVDHLRTLSEDMAARRPAALLTWLESGEQRVIRRDEIGADTPAALAEALEEGFRTDKSRTVEIDGREVFINIYNPPLRLIIIGAVHIAQALAPMAEQAGYDVVIVDPRTAFATVQRFERERLDTRWPDVALPEIGLDTRTALVALTHDPKLDDPALQLAVGSPVFYIGALGSTRTHAKRVERLREEGMSEEGIARISAPVGLPLGGVGPVEIAVSILAEMTATLRGKKPELG
jgi:xanthine dehydrogenase accessory factor